MGDLLRFLRTNGPDILGRRLKWIRKPYSGQWVLCELAARGLGVMRPVRRASRGRGQPATARLSCLPGAAPVSRRAPGASRCRAEVALGPRTVDVYSYVSVRSRRRHVASPRGSQTAASARPGAGQVEKAALQPSNGGRVRGLDQAFHPIQRKATPAGPGAPEVEAFLSGLATQRGVSASTQNQALCAVLFLYKQVLGIEVGWVDGVTRAKRPERVPVVMTR